MPPLKYQQSDTEAEPTPYVYSKKDKKPSLIHVILLNRPLRVVIVMFLAMIIIPPLVYVFFFSKEALPAGDTTLSIGTCAHSPIFQVPCGTPDQSEGTCSNNRCCFSHSTGCYHSLPAKHQFSPAGTWEPSSVLKPLQTINPFGGRNFPSMRLAVRSLTNTRLQIEFWNPLKFQGVEEEIKLPTAEYTYKIFKYSLIEAYRVESNNLLFSTSRGPFMASDNYLEWNMFLGSHILFGLGQKQLERGDKFILMNNQNGSSIPYITAFNNITDEFHGILFNAPSPVEITMLESDLLMLRTFYTDNLKIDILTGPTPLDLLKQLQGINGFYIPPFWAHGIHICREDPTQDVVAAIEDINNILTGPTIFDSHCLLEDLFWLSNSTDPLSEEITKVITDLKVGGKKFVASINSLVLSNTPVYGMAEAFNLLLKTPTKDATYLGKYNSSDVAYINWADSTESMNIVFNSIWPSIFQLPADGFILQNNWMRDITPGVSKISPDLPYLPENIIESMDITTPWNITLPNTGSEILQIHNRMGPLQTIRVSPYLYENQFLASSSFEIGTQSGGYIRNISSSWSGFRSMVNRTISSAVSGVNYFGAPVCGDIEVTSLNEELCIRWYQFSSMTPFFRVVSDRIPIRFSNYALNIMNSIIRRRYTLLSYFNSLMIEGHPVIAPMYFHFYKMANNSRDYDEQFLVGEGLLFAPILLPTATLKRIFFPDTYFEINGGKEMEAEWISYPIVEKDFPLFIRAGYIVPFHNSQLSLSAEETRLTELSLKVALNCRTPTDCSASGALMITNKLSLVFQADVDKLTVKLSTDELTADDSDLNVICGNEAKMTGTILDYHLYGHPKMVDLIKKNVINADLCSNLNVELSFDYVL